MANVPNEGTEEHKGIWQHQRHCAQNQLCAFTQSERQVIHVESIKTAMLLIGRVRRWGDKQPPGAKDPV